jgi:hypothetical protein
LEGLFDLACLNNNNSTILSSPQNQNDLTLGIPVTPTHQVPPINVQQLPPLGPHRKTLERNIRNNHHNQHPPISNGTCMMESTKMMIDGKIIFLFIFSDDVLIEFNFQVIAD